MALVQVMPDGELWKIVENGTDSGSFLTQEEAAEKGRARAKLLHAEFQLHGKDGQIREKDSYGSDPSSSPG